jgi:hypothetical protein
MFSSGSPSFLLAQAIFEPNLFPYGYPNIFQIYSFYTYLPIKIEQSVPKRRHIKFRRRGITQKKTYNIALNGSPDRMISKVPEEGSRVSF